jgi:hypothetical protein
MLQRQVEVRKEPPARRDEVDDLRRAIHRLERADPERHVAIHVLERPQQIDERE